MSNLFLEKLVFLIFMRIAASIQSNHNAQSIDVLMSKTDPGFFYGLIRDFSEIQALVTRSSDVKKVTDHFDKNALDPKQSDVNTQEKHASVSRPFGPNVIGLDSMYDVAMTLSSLDSHGRNRRSDDLSANPRGQPIPEPLADHSIGSSMAEGPLAFIDWSLTSTGDNQRQGLVANGPSMAEEILFGNQKLWQWDDVMKSPPLDSLYGISCCTKLPYICGVDGICSLESASDCQLFCQCAANPHTLQCTETIPRIKSIMRRLEKKFILEVATNKNIVIPPSLKQQLETLEAALNTLAVTSSSASSTSGLSVTTPRQNIELYSRPSSSWLESGFTTQSSKGLTKPPSLLTNELSSNTTVMPFTPASEITTHIKTGSADMITNVSNTQSSSSSITTTDEKAGGSNLTHNHCFQCEEKGGTCVMGNDFRAHCVKDMADGCEHFQCIHGSCISTDGSYTCECHEGWIGPFCDKPCPIQCGQNGFCSRIGGSHWNSSNGDDVTFPDHAHNNGSGDIGVGCVCHWNYTGEKCEEKRQLISPIQKVVVSGSRINTWQVIVVVMSTTVFLASFTTILTCILWRRQWIPLRKLVFFFQDFEEDDGKQYDAFISYKGCPRDERFVLNHLYPKLEKELDFRLCLHFRDFPPGHPIANNIIDAIEKSRRTIMILSPAYVKSEWCRMEYQKAQHEMLRLRHRLIPVVLEDIEDVPGVDKNLMTILETVTYIKWPGEMESSFSKRSSHFWKLLELSMPKKRPDCSRSVSSSGSCTGKPLTSCSQSYFSTLVDSFSRYSCSTDSSFLVNFIKNQNHGPEKRITSSNQHGAVKECSNFSNTRNHYSPPLHTTPTSVSSIERMESHYDTTYFSWDNMADNVSSSWKSQSSSDCSTPSDITLDMQDFYIKASDEKKSENYSRGLHCSNRNKCVENMSANRIESVTDTYFHNTDGRLAPIRDVISE